MTVREAHVCLANAKWQVSPTETGDILDDDVTRKIRQSFNLLPATEKDTFIVYFNNR